MAGGIFCFVGLAGQRLFIPHGPLMGVWWTGLIVVTILISYGIAKANLPENQFTQRKKIVRWFLLFWLPLLVLAYTLCLFCVFLPGLSLEYIAVFILLVVSTGYIMLGLMFFRDILLMGILGMIGTIITAVFFLEYNDIILAAFFGIGLIVTGILINRKWRKS